MQPDLVMYFEQRGEYVVVVEPSALLLLLPFEDVLDVFEKGIVFRVIGF